MIEAIIALIIAYLLGSLSSAIIVCKIMHLPDPRSQGSGNAGTTNVLRIGGKSAAIYCLIGDVLKGVIAVLLARISGLDHFMLALVAFAVFLGHLFPVFFQFKGGKGVATAIGAIIVLSFPAGLIAIVIWLIVVTITRYASLASLVAAVFAALLILFLSGWQEFMPVLAMVACIFWKHKENIERLRAGNENKLTL